MRVKALTIAIVAALVGLAGAAQISAQGTQKPAAPVKPAGPGGDLKTALYNWANHMGMIRGVQEVDAIATLEYLGTGTMTVAGQPCKLTKYRATINYQTPGMRADFACTRPDGQTHQEIQVVSGTFAWNEVGQVGGGLVSGEGSAVPTMDALNERLIRLWSGPQGAVKAATAGGANTKVSVVGGKNVVTYPIPGVSGAIATATLAATSGQGPCAMNCAERIEVRLGNTSTEFTYSNYADFNDKEERLDAFFAGRLVEKRGTATVLDLTVNRTNTGNLYIVMPVPANVRKAGQ